MRAEHERVALAAFVACNLAVATNPVAVRFSNRELDPFWGAGLRFAIAAAVLLVLMGLLRLALPRGRALRGAIVFGALNYAAAVGLAYYAFVRVHAGAGQLVYALVPLVTLLLAVLQRQERLHRRAVAGALLALAGVALLTKVPTLDSVPPLSLLALLVSLVCVSQAAVSIRQFPPVHPVAMNAVGTATAAAVLLPAALLAGDSLVLPESAATWVALGFLVAVGSVLMFVLYLVVLTRWAASRAAYVFVLSPFLTLVLSAWLDDEPLGAGLFLGGAVVVAGVYVGALRPRAPRVEAVPAP